MRSAYWSHAEPTVRRRSVRKRLRLAGCD